MEGDINPSPEKRKIKESETELNAKKPRKMFIRSIVYTLYQTCYKNSIIRDQLNRYDFEHEIRIELTSNEENEIIEELTVKIEDAQDSFENAGLSQKLNLIRSQPEVKVEISGESVKIEEISNAEGSEDVLIFPMGSEEVKIEDHVFEETDRFGLLQLIENKDSI